MTVTEAVRALGRGIEGGTFRNRVGAPYKPSVSRRMESSLRLHVVPRIGAWPVAGLTRHDVQRLVDVLAAEHGPETARKAVSSMDLRPQVR